MENIFDSHSHYSDPSFDGDREEVLAGLANKGVAAVIHAGADLETSGFGVEYSQKFPFIYTSIGIHPEYAGIVDSGYISRLSELVKHPKVVAIGEIGLDYHYDGFDKAAQIKLFEEQLDFAGQHSLPVIIHSRDATDDCLKLLQKHSPKGVMHCFSGSAQTAKIIQKMGLYVSFTGVVTFKNAKKACEAVAAVDINRLLLETDCPYMAPEPNRGKRCDSSMISFIAEKIGEIKGIPAQKIIDIANKNTCELFNIKM